MFLEIAQEGHFEVGCESDLSRTNIPVKIQRGME